MKHMKTVLILEHNEEVFDKLTCDVCGAESKWDENWSGDGEERITTTIQIEEELSSARGGQSTLTQFHICPACFKGALTAWFASHRQNPPTVTTSVW
jgi:hypothetical protein